MRQTIRTLKSEGFEKLTEWEIRKDRIKPKSLEFFVNVPCLYAFVVNEDVVRYIGLTDMVIVSRLDHYSYGKQSTNKRVRQSISFQLNKGNSVSIYARHVPLARLAAEERRLINKLSPDWNRM